MVVSVAPESEGRTLRWRLFFWLFVENNLLSEFRLFVFLIFDDLLLNF